MRVCKRGLARRAEGRTTRSSRIALIPRKSARAGVQCFTGAKVLSEYTATAKPQKSIGFTIELTTNTKRVYLSKASANLKK